MITLKKDSVSINKVIILWENDDHVIELHDSEGFDYDLDISDIEIIRCEKVSNLIELKNTKFLNRLMYFITGDSKYIGRKIRDYQLKA